MDKPLPNDRMFDHSEYFETAQALYKRSIQNKITEKDLDTVIAWPRFCLSTLFAAADMVKRYFFGSAVDPCSLMNIKSGACSEDCAFCAQSCYNTSKIEITSLASAEMIYEKFSQAYSQNLTFCVVSSGKRLTPKEVDTLCLALSRCHGTIHASLGILEIAELQKLKESGVVCYNHNLETSSNYFPSIVTTHDYSQRIQTIIHAKKTGLHICSGGIMGINETWEDRKALCMTLKELEVDTIPLNFFNPIPGTRLPIPTEHPLDLLKIISMFRLMHPNKTIKVCGGRELHFKKIQSLIFFAGANGFITGGYLTTQGDGRESDDELLAQLDLSRHTC